jgi:death-on-curing protein
MTKYLKLETIVQMHDIFIDEFGGLGGIRDVNLLISAIETPKATMFGHELYSTIYDKAAAYLFHIIKNHPFNDGNKRTASMTAYMFLKLNKTAILFSDETYEQLVIDIADGKVAKESIAYFFEYGREPEEILTTPT